ncbi:uncharacterized protein LOC131994655 [Stomoxys calcitrans]|uniref:uncharacterized protein LOC131994655 n=1 Tax=Stomoxys calcitrans TaxID=35570 RepID=UPI0027E2ECAB|nr:uncharacterized protein LOC131994655 [Stomoxys calcitrans]
MDVKKLFICIFLILEEHKGQSIISSSYLENLLTYINEVGNMELIENNEAIATTISVHSHHLSKLLNTIAEYWNITSLYIIYNTRLISHYPYQDFLEELCANASYLGQLPRMAISSQHIKSRLIMDNGFRESSLVLTLMHSPHDRVLETTAYATRYKRYCFTIYLLHLFPLSKEDMSFLFEKLWRYQLRRPLVISNGGDLLTMDPYPKLRIVNVTNENVTQYFPKIANTRDFKGYILNVPVQADVPFTLVYRNPKTSEYEMDGIGGWVVTGLMKRLNVTLNVYPLNWNNSDYLYLTHIYDLLLSGEIELSPHMFTTIVQRDLDYSYPYVSSSVCVMAPVPKKKTINLLGFLDWTLCLFLLLMVAVNEIIWKIYWHYRSRMHLSRPFLPYRSLYVIFLFLGIPLPSWSVPTIRRLRFCSFIRILLIYFLLTYCGMYISQIFSSNLSSFLTASFLKSPSFHLDNIFESEVPLMLGYNMANTLKQR